MSYALFQKEIRVGLGPHPTYHYDESRAAKIISLAYVNLITRYIDIPTGGGMSVAIAAYRESLRIYLHNRFQENRNRWNRMAYFNILGPAILNIWVGHVIMGPIGFVTVLNPGIWSAPYIPPQKEISSELFLKMLSLTIYKQMMSMVGIYTSFITGASFTWSGAAYVTSA